MSGFYHSMEAPEILRPLVSRLVSIRPLGYSTTSGTCAPKGYKLEPFPALSESIVSVRGTGYLYEQEK